VRAPTDCKTADSGIRTAPIQGIQRSLADPEHTAAYVGKNAQETDASIQARHISMFVNELSLDLGTVEHAAEAKLEDKARAAGVIS
jgi:predicted solute-binding protein